MGLFSQPKSSTEPEPPEPSAPTVAASPDPPHNPFPRTLEFAETQLASLITEVANAISVANEAVRQGDPAVGSDLGARQVLIGNSTIELEQMLQVYLARFAPMGRDLRLVLTALRMAPELGRSVDLARHIAERADLVNGLPAPVPSLVNQMGSVALDMWREVTEAWRDRDADAAARLERTDDQLDDLQGLLSGVAADEQLSVAVAMQLNLLVRFYERLGDHAVHVSARIRWLAG
jgi:phosphate transport system protein